jgi:hypothetical protein
MAKLWVEIWDKTSMHTEGGVVLQVGIEKAAHIWEIQLSFTSFPIHYLLNQNTKANSVAFSPQPNYTYRAAVDCRRSKYKLLSGRKCRVVSASDPHGR